jgi:hypothetical protein
MKQALARLKPSVVRQLILDAERIDRSIKGAENFDPWVELEGMVARMAGVKLPRAA